MGRRNRALGFAMLVMFAAAVFTAFFGTMQYHAS
jgi:hypothetical protein